MKTIELNSATLDWAVAKCEGYFDNDMASVRDGVVNVFYFESWSPSTNWAQGGAIIEREEISVSREFASNRVEWAAWTPAPIRDDAEAFGYGATPLVAAMRCYVASKLGDEVQIPEELIDE